MPVEPRVADGSSLSSSDLARGRLCYDQRAWADAHEALARADGLAPLALADLERLALSAGLAGRDEEMLKANERLYHLCCQTGDELRAAGFAFWAAFRLLAMGEPARANGWLARSQRLVERLGECAVTGWLAIAQVRRHLVVGETDAAYSAAVSAAAIGERFADVSLVNFARYFQGHILLNQGSIERGLALIDEAMLAASAGELSPVVTGIVYCAAIMSCQRIYALDRAREWTSALVSWCDAQPQLAPFAGECLVHRAEILELEGAWRESIEEARRAARRVVTEPRATANAFYQQAEIHRLRGETELAEEAYREASQRGRDPQPGLALLRLAQGRHAHAATAIRRVASAAGAPLERTRLLPALVEISLAVGDLDEARAASAELETIASTFDIEVLAAMAAHARGAVLLAGGDARGAVPPLRQAFRTWQQIGAPYLAARIRATLARACRALGDDDGASLELAAAREVFDRLGAMPDLAALDGARPAVLARHGLTPRELEVLRLVATGKTNKLIARELFLSEKTVDRHVSNIFAKVKVATRAAATAYAYEHGLVATAADGVPRPG